MSALIVYDSAYGNTAGIANAIRSGLGEDVSARALGDIDPGRLSNLSLLVVGSPTQGGRPTAAMLRWLDDIPPMQIRGLSFAAFDTRLDFKAQVLPLRVLMGLIGYAAPRIAAALAAKGGRQAADPKGFVVAGREGPLAAGELERARAWASTLLKTQAKAAA